MKNAPSVSAPDGQPVSVRSSVVEGRTVLNAENLTMPGFYLMATTEQPEGKPAIAVNLPRDESDLTPVADKEIPKQLGVERANVATDLATLRKLIEEHRIGRTYGEHLLWLAFILTVIEFAYANLLARGKAGAAKKVSVDAAGHVETHAKTEAHVEV